MLIGGLLLLPCGIASAQHIDVELVAGASEQVGRARIEIRQWSAIGADHSALRAWGKRSVQAVVPDGDRSRVILLDWDEAADAPANLFWREIATVTDAAEAAPTMLPRPDRADIDPRLHEETLKWRSTPGSAAMAWVEFASGAELLLTHHGTQILGHWQADAGWHARFSIGDEEHLAWFVDGDLDGVLRGADDRWIAGPVATLNRLTLANPLEEMRPLAEPWCFGAWQLRIVEPRGTRMVLEAGEPGDREKLLAQHYARVQADFERNLPARALMLDKQGEDPDRPAAEARLEWRYASDLEEALAMARSAGKPLLVEFTSFSCTFCRLLSYVTHPDAEVDAELRRFACVRLIAELDPDKTWERLGVGGFPSTAWIGDDGAVRANLDGFAPPSRFVATLREWAADS